MRVSYTQAVMIVLVLGYFFFMGILFGVTYAAGSMKDEICKEPVIKQRFDARNFNYSVFNKSIINETVKQ